MAAVTEQVHSKEFILCDSGSLSYDKKTATGAAFVAGAVMAAIKKALAAAPIPTVVGTGDGTISAIRLNEDAQTGNYVITCTSAVTNGGVFSVVAPDGAVLPSLTLTVGAGASTQYKSTHLDFTITDGSTDFAVNDSFTVAVTAGGTPVVVGTGNGVMSAISLGPEAQLGTYRAVCTATETHGGTFRIEAPDGSALADLVMTAGAGASTAYTSRHINCTITDGSTDFAAGDYFNLVVANGSGKIVAFDPATYDGSHRPVGILTADADASAADQQAVILARLADYDEDLLTWGAAVTTAQQAAAKNLMAEQLMLLAR